MVPWLTIWTSTLARAIVHLSISIRHAVLEVITDDLDGAIPASPAVAALHVLLGCRANMSFGRYETFPEMYATRRHPIANWRETVHEMRRVPDAEVRRNWATHPPIRFHRLILSRRQPELDPGEIQTDPDYLSEVFEILQIAGIMPPEVSISRAINERAYGFDPARVRQAGEPFLHRSLDYWKQVPAAQGIAIVTNRFRDQLQKATESTSLRR